MFAFDSIGSHKGQLDGVQYSTGSAITDHTETQEDPSPSSKPNKSQPSQHIEVYFILYFVTIIYSTY